MSKREKAPLITIIIPTKDRADYLHHTLKTCSFQDYDNMEVIVSDDGSTDATQEVVREASRKDKRIRYVSPGKDVGMLDNFEFVLKQVRPGYVLALGGDDALLPHGAQGIADALTSSGLEMVAWPAPAFFYAKTKMKTGQLIVRTKGVRIESGQRVVSSRQFLNRQARDLSYVNDVESPMFYVKGAVSTQLIEQVRLRTPGRKFYACATPDGYSGIVLAGEVECYAYSAVPFAMHGVSPTSAGVNYYASDDRAKRQSDAFFRHASTRPMHRELGNQPYSPLIALMTADYLLTARDLPGWPGYFPPICYKQLLRKGLEELASGLYPEERIQRELTILNGVAQHHGLRAYFHRKVKRIRRTLRTTLEGNAISPSRLYLNADQYKIFNVYDASYVAYYLHQIAPQINLGTAWSFLKNSIGYRLRSFHWGNRLPLPDER